MHAKIMIRRIKAAKKASNRCQKLNTNNGNKKLKFRSFQVRQWQHFLEEAKAFHDKHGHCIISQKSNAKPELVRWAKRQRFLYKQYQRHVKRIGQQQQQEQQQHDTMDNGLQQQQQQQQQKPSPMNEERIAALNAIGFCWDAHSMIWEERFKELKAFNTIHGHFHVPTKAHTNVPLATWLRQQRYEYRLWKQGKAHCITAERRLKLSAIGFPWEANSNKKE